MTAEGVRLRNSTGVDCFLNCATNILASNKLIRSTIFKDSTADGGAGIREEPGMNTVNGIGIRDIRVYSPNDNQWAIASNGVHFLVAQELKRLISLNGNPGDTVILRKLLGQLFGLFREKRQNDAGDALFSILECLPQIEKMFSISFRFIRACVSCNSKKVKEEREGFINLGYLNYGDKKLSLQEALEAYENSEGELVMECLCDGSSEESRDYGYGRANKPHHEIREITEYPEVLLLKIKGRENLLNLKIDLSDSFTFGGFPYVFQSGMLYSGMGDRGHWRCMIRTSNNFIIYDDDKIPYPGTYKDLRKYATDLVFIKNRALEGKGMGESCRVLGQGMKVHVQCKLNDCRQPKLQRVVELSWIEVSYLGSSGKEYWTRET